MLILERRSWLLTLLAIFVILGASGAASAAIAKSSSSSALSSAIGVIGFVLALFQLSTKKRISFSPEGARFLTVSLFSRLTGSLGRLIPREEIRQVQVTIGRDEQTKAFRFANVSLELARWNTFVCFAESEREANEIAARIRRALDG